MNALNHDEAALVRRLASRPCWPTDHLPEGVSISHMMNLDRDGAPVEFSLTKSGPWGRLTPQLARSLAWGNFYARVSAVGHDALGKTPPKASDAQTEPERALMLYRWAINASGGELTDQKAYEFVRSHAEGEALPDFDTWSRYLRRAREAAGAQKRQPRAGRAGRSISRHTDL